MADRRDLLLLDAELREAWGIDVGSIEEPGWWKRLERDCPSELVARFREAHEVYSEAEIDGGLQTELAERAFFDLVADDRLLGRVHSHRRPVIIDCAVAVDDLVLGGGIAGPVLDLSLIHI